MTDEFLAAFEAKRAARIQADRSFTIAGETLTFRPTVATEVGMRLEQMSQTVRIQLEGLRKQAAEAAAKGGKTAYRYARAPYLTSGPNASILDSLSTKLGNMPGDVMQAFVMGYDNTANFGIGNAISDAGLRKDPYGDVNTKLQKSNPAPPTAVPGAHRDEFNPLNERVGGVDRSAPMKRRGKQSK